MTKRFISLAASLAAAFMMFLSAVPVSAQTNGGGPYGDIDGAYTWQINGKGWTIYSQNGYSWVYDDNGNRTYLDSYGNKLYNVTPAAAKTITQYKLTYYSKESGVDIYTNPDGKLYYVTSDGILHAVGDSPAPTPTPTPSPTISNYTMHYYFTSPEGYNVYSDGYNNLWWFSQGGIPNRWTWGYTAGSYWKTGIPDYTYYYSYRSSDGYYIYRDDYNNTWWFGADGTPHLVKQGSGGGSSGGGGSQGGGGSKPAETNVDYSRTNVMEVDGHRTIVYVGQYWQTPTTVSWAPAGSKLIGWDYEEGSNYARWKPGAYVKNTGSDLYLYPVYGGAGSGIGATRG